MYKTIAILLLTLAALFLLAGCSNTDEINNTAANEYPYNETYPDYDVEPDCDESGSEQEQEVAEVTPVPFPYDSFPEEISFTTTFEVYPVDAETITATLENLATEPSSMSSGHSVDVLRQEGDGWVRVPGGGSFQFGEFRMGTGGVVHFTIVNGEFQLGISPGGIVFINGFTPGTYRIVLPRIGFWYLEDADDFDSRVDPIWRGAVWTEFIISDEEIPPAPFPHDSFPEEIGFTSEFGVYPTDTETITVTLANLATNPSYGVSSSTYLYLMKREGAGWIPVRGGGIFHGSGSWTEPGDSIDYTIINSEFCSNCVGISSFDILFTGGLAAGTYRVVLPHVGLWQLREVGNLHSPIDPIWRGAVWAEFVIEGCVKPRHRR